MQAERRLRSGLAEKLWGLRGVAQPARRLVIDLEMVVIVKLEMMQRRWLLVGQGTESELQA